MQFDDEFFLDDDELNEDVQLTIVDSARENLLKLIRDTSESALDSIKYNELSEVEAKVRIISNYLDKLLKLSQDAIQKLSDDEITELIEEVLKESTELTFENINDVLGLNDEDTEVITNQDDDSTKDDDALDF